jgi:cytochrome c-type biogenesis protein CcmH
VLTPIIVTLVGAVLAAAAVLWALRAARRAGGDADLGKHVLLIGAAAGVVALAAYLSIGSPALPGGAYAARLEALKQRPPQTFTVEEALALLAEGARTHPEDATPHIFSGELLLSNGRAEEAARSFDAALRRDPRSGPAMIGFAKSRLAIDGGFTPDALALFEQASELTNDPAPWLYRAMAAMEQGDETQARRMWSEALSRMDEDDPRRDMAERFASGARR